MTRAVRLTREQKILLSEQGLHPDEWLLVEDLPDKLVILSQDRTTRTVVMKPQKGARK